MISGRTEASKAVVEEGLAFALLDIEPLAEALEDRRGGPAVETADVVVIAGLVDRVVGKVVPDSGDVVTLVERVDLLSAGRGDVPLRVESAAVPTRPPICPPPPTDLGGSL